jgi:mRNA-degrading endonuclease YafQ of YafQ-DinJ toxin-antitoxin module
MCYNKTIKRKELIQMRLKIKLLAWLANHIPLHSSYVTHSLMFRMQDWSSADDYWNEVKQMKAEHNCATYSEYLDWKYPQIGS